MIGDKFGRLLVLRERIIKHRTYYECQCDCGNTCCIRSDNLKTGKTILTMVNAVYGCVMSGYMIL